jgi:hypothetical protein
VCVCVCVCMCMRGAVGVHGGVCCVCWELELVEFQQHMLVSVYVYL